MKPAPKLRTSCDNCLTAKVRCTKTKPTCARCMEHGSSCAYGYSQRGGKSKSFTLKSAPESSSPSVESNPSQYFRRPSRVSDPVQRNDLEQWRPHHQQQYFIDSTENLPQESYDTMEHTGFAGVSHDTDISMYQTSTSSEYQEFAEGSIFDEIGLTNLGGVRTGNSEYHRSGSSLPSLAPDTRSGFYANSIPYAYPNRTIIESALSSRSSTSDETFSSPSRAQETPFSLNFLGTQNASLWPSVPHDSPVGNFDGSCDCFTNIFDALSSLQHCCNTPGVSLDSVLNVNKEAMEKCQTMLGCPCATKENSLLLLCVTVSRILLLYRLACKHYFSAAVRDCSIAPVQYSGQPMALNYSSASSSVENMAPYSSAMSHVRLTLGNYQLDLDNERKLNSKIVKLAVQKVNQLLNSLEDIVHTTQEQSSVTLYKSLLAHLVKDRELTAESISAWR